MKPENIHLISCSSELCAYRRGGSMGPVALLTAARTLQESFLLGLSHEGLYFENGELNQPPESSSAKYIQDFLPVFEQLSIRMGESLDAGQFPLCLTGDHSQGAALLRGIKLAFPRARLGVVWIDAHADLHSPYTTPSGNLHGMPLAMALAEDNLECRRNQPAPEVVESWSRLKTGLAGKRVLNPEDLVFLGVRDIEEEERHLIDRLGIRCQDVHTCREKGMGLVVAETLEYLKACDVLFVSFDVDCMDPDLVSDGTGTPVPGGFMEEESAELLSGLLQSEKVIGMEVSEINPALDTGGNSMAEACTRILGQCFQVTNPEAELEMA